MAVMTEPLADFCEETAVRLMMRHGHMMVPYYSMCLIDSQRIPTLATNGLTMWINKGFYHAMNREQRMTCMAHELWHKMLLHNVRRGTRDPELYNVAGDHVINLILTKAGFAPLVNVKVPGWGQPFTWVCDERFDGMTTEQVYDILKSEQEQGGGKQPKDGQPGGPPGEGKGNGDQSGPPTMMDIIEFGKDPDGKPVDKEGKPNGKHPGKTDQQVMQEFVDKVRQELDRAATMAKMAGKGTFGFDCALDEMNHVKIPWYEYLEEFFVGLQVSEFSYARFERRTFAVSGMLAPDMYSPSMGGVLYGVDCSGSVSNADLALVNMHQKDLIKAAAPAWLEVAYFCDEIIGEPERYEKGECDIELRRKGSGGTCFAPVMEYAKNMDEPPALIIMLTDMEGDNTEEDPDIPVLWLSVGRGDAKFGTVIKVE